MRVPSQHELCRLTKAELSVLRHQIASELAYLPDGSLALRNAASICTICQALARPEFRPC
jgi:hypothetical protein